MNNVQLALTTAATLVAGAGLYKWQSSKTADPFLEIAEKEWVEIMGEHCQTKPAFKRIGGNSLNYKVTTSEAQFCLKINGVDTASGLFGFNREEMESNMAGDNWAWLKICTRLASEAGVGPKFFGCTTTAMVIEWMDNGELGPETGILLEHAKDENKMVEFGQFLGQLGKLKSRLERDKEAQDMAEIVLSSGHPWNLIDPVKTFTFKNYHAIGWFDMVKFNRELIDEWNYSEDLEKRRTIDNEEMYLSSFGTEKVFVHTDPHAANFMLRDNGTFGAIDLEIASVQPAATMLWHAIWTGQGITSALFGLGEREGIRKNVAKGYLLEVSQMTEKDEKFEEELLALLWTIEYYRNRTEVVMYGMMCSHMQYKYIHGLLLWCVLPRLKACRELIEKGLKDSMLRKKIATQGLDQVRADLELAK